MFPVFIVQKSNPSDERRSTNQDNNALLEWLEPVSLVKDNVFHVMRFLLRLSCALHVELGICGEKTVDLIWLMVRNCSRLFEAYQGKPHLLIYSYKLKHVRVCKKSAVINCE